MKLYITSDQLNELSDESYSKLSSFIFEEGVGMNELDPDLLDAGTMMDFLQRSPLVEGIHIYYLRSTEGGEWGMEMKVGEEVKKFKEKEYIDLLWEATKDLLEYTLN